MADPNSSYGILATTTLANRTGKIADNISAKITLLDWLRKAGQVKPWEGGTEIVEELMYALGSSQSWSGYDTITVQEVEGISAASYPMKNVSTPVAISREDEMKNRSKYQVINMLDAKVMQAELTVADTLEQMFFGDGLGNAGKDMNGLQAIIENTAAATTPTLTGTGTVGNISRGTYAWWKNYSVLGTQAATAFDNLLSRMSLMNLALSRQNSTWKAIFTTDTVLAGYEAKLQPYVQLYSDKEASAGFPGLPYLRRPIFTSAYCPSATMYFLNPDYLHFRPHVEANFVTTPFREPDFQHVRYAEILVSGNLTCSNCARQGSIAVIS